MYSIGGTRIVRQNDVKGKGFLAWPILPVDTTGLLRPVLQIVGSTFYDDCLSLVRFPEVLLGPVEDVVE
jgi:hypothetical protein